MLLPVNSSGKHDSLYSGCGCLVSHASTDDPTPIEIREEIIVLSGLSKHGKLVEHLGVDEQTNKVYMSIFYCTCV